MKHISKALFAFLGLLPVSLIAQSNYTPGYIVNLKGDTVRGLINYSEWVNNPKRILFKESLSGNTVKLTAANTRFFMVRTDHLAEYVRYAGPISNDLIDINRIQIGRDTSFRLDTVFLKVLQKGKNLILYAYTDDVKTRFFISRSEENAPEELTYRIYYKASFEPGENRTAYENTFKNQLYEVGVKSNVMTPDLKKDIQALDYSEKDIIAISSKINEISSADASKNDKIRHRPINKVIAILGAVVIVIVLINDFSNIHSH